MTKIHDSQAEKLSTELLSIAKGQLLVRMRFLDRALYELKPRVNALFPIATDGRNLWYQPVPLLKEYKSNRMYPQRIWLHTLMHCLFRHMMVSNLVNRRLWNIACDIAAEAMIADLRLPGYPVIPLPPLLGAKLKSAERIYRYLLDHPLAEKTLREWESRFTLDDHSLWYMEITGMQLIGNRTGANSEPSNGQREAYRSSRVLAELAGRWKEISERMQMDIKVFARQQGPEPGDMLQVLQALNREKYDYAAFLRKFAARTEVMKLSPDEFDYIYYTYGLTLYKDTPLIEPLEYRDDQRIRELVIAIDTSGSVAGKLVQDFLQKTFNTLKQEEAFDRRFVLHIVQCDAEIQEKTVITTQDELDQYIRTMKIRGLGGTDFRPVFEYVQRLRENGQLRRLKGLLYFTDGYGIYPERMPDYQTAFVFLEQDELIAPSVPSWAMKVIVENASIERMSLW